LFAHLFEFGIAVPARDCPTAEASGKIPMIITVRANKAPAISRELKFSATTARVAFHIATPSFL
jgi:hypothetical protein